MGKLLSEFTAYLSFIKSAQHNYGVEEHNHIATKHLPNIKKDCGETDIIETTSSEGIHFKTILSILVLTKINHVLFHLQTVLVSNLKLKPNTTR